MAKKVNKETKSSKNEELKDVVDTVVETQVKEEISVETTDGLEEEIVDEIVEENELEKAVEEIKSEYSNTDKRINDIFEEHKDDLRETLNSELKKVEEATKVVEKAIQSKAKSVPQFKYFNNWWNGVSYT